MYRRTAHILTRNAARTMPKWVIFFDTETQENKIDATTKSLTLKLGYALKTRRTDHGELARVNEIMFTELPEFHGYLTRELRGRERYYLVAHNVSFDIRVTHLFHYLVKEGWIRTLLIDEQINFIARWRKGETTLLILNNQQLFNISLKLLGESIGFPKMEMPAEDAGDEAWASYCRQDVEVMRRAWEYWIQYITAHDLGNFAITAASQAFTSYRHRFMPKKIWIHTNPKAIALERASYHGGRVECFYIGEYKSGKVYHLDVNSMYPSVMQRSRVPVKLLAVYGQKESHAMYSRIKNWEFIAEATVRVEQPRLPVLFEGRLCFPVGVVRGVFAKPELEAACRDGNLVDLHSLAVYRGESIFTSFVEFFFSQRLDYKREGNAAFEYLSKIFMNSLYGKFGQRQFEYEKIGEGLGIEDGYYNETWDEKEGYVKLRVLNGVVERAVGRKEGYNSFVAIASYITALARVRLYELIERAGAGNVLYCDTDSLFVTEEGFRRLREEINPLALGKLKLEGVEDGITIRAPKWYTFGKKTVSKGIRKEAQELAPGTFVQDKFVSFRGSVRAHNPQGVIVKRIVKVLSPHYRKGVVLPSGQVVPFVME